MPRYHVFVGYEAGPKCFRVTKVFVLRQFAKAAFDAVMDVERSREAAEAAARVSSLVSEVATANRLWSSSSGLPLC